MEQRIVTRSNRTFLWLPMRIFKVRSSVLLMVTAPPSCPVTPFLNSSPGANTVNINHSFIPLRQIWYLTVTDGRSSLTHNLRTQIYKAFMFRKTDLQKNVLNHKTTVAHRPHKTTLAYGFV